MDSASPRPPLGLGDLLMGRYRLDSELFTNSPGALRFRATDKILSRQTDVHLLTGPRTADAIDAARRAALIDDPRLARIIDAGSYSGISFVLTAALEGVSLADVGPLGAAQARAVAGEVASALQVASEQDVHHLALRPELVFLGQGDTVQVGGLAWDAALRGETGADVQAADAADAHALVSVLYAALTARWPGATPSVMPLPPSWDGNPVAPIELVSAVPGDLNTLCAVTLAGAGGPRSAAGVVDYLGVWPRVRITLRHTVSVRGPIPRAVTPPTPIDDLELELPEPVPLAEGEAEPPDAEPPAAAPAGAEPLGPSEADVEALAADEEIQRKLAAIEAILAPLGYDLTPTRRRLGLEPATPPASPGIGSAAAPDGRPEGVWDPPTAAVLPPQQVDLLARLSSLADAPLPRRAGELEDAPVPALATQPALADDAVPQAPAAGRFDAARLSALAGLVVSAAQAEAAARAADGEADQFGEAAAQEERFAAEGAVADWAVEDPTDQALGDADPAVDAVEEAQPAAYPLEDLSGSLAVDLLGDVAWDATAVEDFEDQAVAASQDDESTLVLEPIDAAPEDAGPEPMFDPAGTVEATPTRPRPRFTRRMPTVAPPPPATPRQRTKELGGGVLATPVPRGAESPVSGYPVVAQAPLTPADGESWPPAAYEPAAQPNTYGQAAFAETQDAWQAASQPVPQAVPQGADWPEGPVADRAQEAPFVGPPEAFDRAPAAPAGPATWLVVVVFALVVGLVVLLGVWLMNKFGILAVGLDLSPIDAPGLLEAVDL
ncbi:MAG: hypothetical protein LBD97_06930 [Bifidobacteriaceae bacterium]|jgi:hypothetical protein|nr:hypothetical protein [Bifidobacteriaceae bacterium]